MSVKPGQFYEFGSFRLIPDERLLLRDGKPVPLPPKTFDLLEALVRNSGHLLEKDELMKTVWPDAFVEEGNLSLNISNLRKALSSGLDGRAYIETVPKRGYRFVAAVVTQGINEPDPKPRKTKARWLLLAAAVAALTAGWYQWRATSAPNPNFSDAYDLMVRGKRHALRSGPTELELAHDLLSQSIRLDPGNPDAHAWLAYTMYLQYDLTLGTDATVEAATAHAYKALALDPKSVVARHALICMSQFGVPGEEALRLGREALAADSGNLDAVGAAAEGYFRAGIHDKAIELFEKVILADPGRSRVRTQLVRTLLFRGDYERGLAIALERGERDSAGVWTMLHLKELGRFDEAKRYATSDLKGDSAFGWYMAGCVLQAAGDERGALELWTEGARRAEGLLAVREHKHARSFLGIMYAKLGLRERALEQAGRLLAAHPKSPYVLFFVAKLHAILGNRREALDCLRRAIDSGFLMLPFLYYHARPALGLYSLRDDPEFLAMRNGLEKRVKLLESSAADVALTSRQSPR